MAFPAQLSLWLKILHILRVKKRKRNHCASSKHLFGPKEQEELEQTDKKGEKHCRRGEKVNKGEEACVVILVCVSNGYQSRWDASVSPSWPPKNLYLKCQKMQNHSLLLFIPLQTYPKSPTIYFFS